MHNRNFHLDSSELLSGDRLEKLPIKIRNGIGFLNKHIRDNLSEYKSVFNIDSSLSDKVASNNIRELLISVLREMYNILQTKSGVGVVKGTYETISCLPAFQLGLISPSNTDNLVSCLFKEVVKMNKLSVMDILIGKIFKSNIKAEIPTDLSHDILAKTVELTIPCIVTCKGIELFKNLLENTTKDTSLLVKRHIADFDARLRNIA